MQFLRSDVLRVVTQAYLASRKPQWDSYSEYVRWLTRVLTLRKYRGKNFKTELCNQIESEFFKPLEINPARISKWIELCCHLDKIAIDNGSLISDYFNFLRKFILLHFSKQLDFKSEIDTYLKNLQEAKSADAKKDKPTVKEVEKLLQDFIKLDASKVTAELDKFFARDILPHTAKDKFSGFDAFLAAAIVSEKKDEKKEEPRPANTTADVQRKLYSTALKEGIAKQVAAEQKLAESKAVKGKQPVPPLLTIPEDPFEVDLLESASHSKRKRHHRRKSAAKHYEEPQLRRRHHRSDAQNFSTIRPR